MSKPAVPFDPSGYVTYADHKRVAGLFAEANDLLQMYKAENKELTNKLHVAERVCYLLDTRDDANAIDSETLVPQAEAELKSEGKWL